VTDVLLIFRKELKIKLEFKFNDPETVDLMLQKMLLWNGSFATHLPSSVIMPSVIAPIDSRVSIACTSCSFGGDSTKSNDTGSTPNSISLRRACPRFTLRISGVEHAFISLNSFSEYSLKHFPGAVRPALPLL
jgi:hypothetical protein